MSKKGAVKTGGGAANRRAKDSAMAHNLPPAPTSWRTKATEFPYHGNMGVKHVKIGASAKHRQVA